MNHRIKLLLLLCVIALFLPVNLFGQVATDSFTPISSSTSVITMSETVLPMARSLDPSYFHDELNGSCLGSAAFSGYTAGVLDLSAHFAGGQNNIGYSSGGQIKRSGFISFYLYSHGYYSAYNACNFIFTQAGFGGATFGSIQLWLGSNNQLVYSQIGSGFWNYMSSAPIPLNTWVKITAVYGSYGMYLYVDDQLVASDPNRRDAISTNNFYIGTKSFYGSEKSFAGNVDEIMSGIPAVKIITPNDNLTFNFDESITFSGLGNNLIWSENGNQLAVGNDVNISLSPGEHTITLNGTDFAGQPGSDNVIVIVGDAPPVGHEILSLTTSKKLEFGTNNSCGGIDFKATTSGPTTVDFMYNGRVIGSAETDENNVAQFFWLPRGATYDPGVDEIVAQNEVNSITEAFKIYRYKWDIVYADPRSWRSGLHHFSMFFPAMTDEQWVLAKGNMSSWPAADDEDTSSDDESADESDKDPSNDLYEEPEAETCSISFGNSLETKPTGNSAPISVSDPVNIVFGNYLLKEEDLIIKSAASLVLPRFYNSLNFDSSPFGRGWTSSIFTHVELELPKVTFHNSNGSRVVFTEVNGVFVSETLTELTLTHLEGSDWWQVTHPRGETWTFDQDGKILRMAVNCCGAAATNGLNFAYSQNGNLEKVTNHYGQWFEFTFNAEGKISEINDSSNRTVKYEYDSSGNLVSFIDALNLETKYLYNRNGFMTEVQRPGDRISKIAYNGSRVSSLTDTSGNVSQFSWDLENRNMTLIDVANRNHIYSFDEEWQLIKYSVPSASLVKEFEFSNGLVNTLKDTNSNNTNIVYNNKGLTSSITYASGYKIDYTYHPELNRLISKTDSLNRTWLYTWCQRGNLTNITLPDGNSVTFEYDNYNNRTKKIDQLGRITRWVYASGRMIQKINPDSSIYAFAYDTRGNLTSKIDPLNRETKYIYDNQNRVIKRIMPDGSYLSLIYDASGNLISQQDHLNRIALYTYDASRNPKSITWPNGTQTYFEYNALNQRTSTIDSLGRVYKYQYNLHNRTTKMEYPDSSFVSFNYDNEGNFLSKTDELGHLTSYEYDAMGRIIASIDAAGSRWEYSYDIAGRRTSTKDPLDRVTTYEHDILDRVVKTISPDATFSTSSYDAIGNMLISTNALNQQTIYEYDGLNRQVKTTAPNGAQFTTSYDAGGQVLSNANALGNSTSYAYDLAGRRVAITNALGHISQYFYDNAGRLINTIDAMGGISTMTYDIMDRTIANSDPLGRVSNFEYDAAGRRIAKTDALGRRSIFGYDDRDRLTTEVDGEGHRVSYTYDASGKKLSFTDGAGRIWRWTYDILGRNTSVIDPLGNTDSKTYNAVSNLIAKTNARGQTTTNEFDLMNRLVKINYPDSTIATFAYDVLGRETYRSGSAGAVEKTYDIAGNLAKENFVNLNKAWNYTYDLMGNKTQAVSPENQTNSYSYDALERLLELDTGRTEEKVNYAYDNLGRTIEVKRSGVTTANSFDAVSQLLETKHYKLVLDHQSHGCGKKNRHRNRHTPPTYKEEIIALRQYNYDLVGNRSNMTDEEGQITSYIYDRSNWLLQATYPNNDVIAYTYNNAGDRLSEQVNSDPAILYSYNAAGRMLTKGDETFSYDADGNMLTDAVATYTWNSDNRLMKVEKVTGGCKHDKHRKGHGYGHYKHGKADVSYEEYAYLPEDWRRVSRTVGTVKTIGKHTKNEAESFMSVYDGADESHEYEMKKSKYSCYKRHKKNNKLKLVKTYISGPGTDDLEFTRSKKESYSMLKDGLGSTIVLTGKNGKTIARIGYDAWGNFKWSGKAKKSCNVNDYKEYLGRYGKTRGFGSKHYNSWSFGKKFAEKLTPYLYTGRRYNQFTGQYFNRNRYYQPKYGRFISKDPIGFSGDINLYRYADGNPVLNTDPEGKMALTSTALAITITALVAVKYTQMSAAERALIGNDFKAYISKTIDDKCQRAKLTYVMVEAMWEDFVYFSKGGRNKGTNWATELAKARNSKDPCKELERMVDLPEYADSKRQQDLIQAAKYLGCRNVRKRRDLKKGNK